MLVSYFNEAYILKARTMQKDVEHAEAWTRYEMETQAGGKVVARTNVKGLPRVILQNLKPVIGRWRKQMGLEG
jgi:hypothetical protein